MSMRSQHHFQCKKALLRISLTKLACASESELMVTKVPPPNVLTSVILS